MARYTDTYTSCDWCDEPQTHSFPNPNDPRRNEYACDYHDTVYGPVTASYQQMMTWTMRTHWTPAAGFNSPVVADNLKTAEE